MRSTGSRDSQVSITRRPGMTGNDNLPAYPEGWYFVTTRKSLLREKLIEKTWMGEEIVAWCDEAGHICVADSVCPHLGSSLGPEVGGNVCSGRLVCPFHGFEFDTTGQYVPAPWPDRPWRPRRPGRSSMPVLPGLPGREPGRQTSSTTHAGRLNRQLHFRQTRRSAPQPIRKPGALNVVQGNKRR